jgi:hypothetical protein
MQRRRRRADARELGYGPTVEQLPDGRVRVCIAVPPWLCEQHAAEFVADMLAVVPDELVELVDDVELVGVEKRRISRYPGGENTPCGFTP